MTISELLKTKMFRNNQTYLARGLGVNRGTFRKYMDDDKGEFHFVKKVGDEYQLFTNQTKKCEPKYSYKAKSCAKNLKS